jgi:hypothetical protein
MNTVIKRIKFYTFCQFWMVQVGLGLFLAVHAAENVCSKMYYRSSEN